MREKIYQYKLSMKVRDYECDLQGVVNNANYQHYLEHARHEFLIAAGFNFKQLHDQGIDAMVARVEIDYKKFLTSGDEFDVCITVSRETFRLIFQQDIYRTADKALRVSAKVYTVCVHNGRLARQLPEMDQLIANAEKLPPISIS